MIDVKKVRQMTWLSVYENGAGRKDLKMNQQSCRTYTALRLIESVTIVTIIFAMVTVVRKSGHFPFKKVSSTGSRLPDSSDSHSDHNKNMVRQEISCHADTCDGI